MRACNCPNCNANITLDESRDFGFCQYCGVKIMLDDYRSTHRVVDEARIREAELEKEIRLKELELQEKENERNRKGRMLAFKIAGGIAIIGFASFLIESYNLFGMALIVIAMWIALFTVINGEEQKKKTK